MNNSRIPELDICVWFDKGKKVIEDNYLNDYVEFIRTYIDESHTSSCIEHVLQIITALNEGKQLSEAKEIFDNQGHSILAESIILKYVSQLCSRGKMFCKYVRSR